MRKPKLPKSTDNSQRKKTIGLDRTRSGGVVVAPREKGVLRQLPGVEVERGGKSLGSDEQIAWDVLRKVTDRPVMNAGHYRVDLSERELISEVYAGTQPDNSVRGFHYTGVCISVHEYPCSSTLELVIPPASANYICQLLTKMGFGK